MVDLQRLTQLKEDLDRQRPLPAAVVRELHSRYVVRFTYHSNAIEGNTLTQSETELVLEKGITVGGKTLREHLEVIGHRDAIGYIEYLGDHQTTEPIGAWEIRHIHNLVTRAENPEEAGAYRRVNVQAAGTNYRYPEAYLVPQLITDFTTFLAQEHAAPSLHPVVLATEAHLRLVTIHPFQDRNGRTARLLMNLLLLRAGYPIAVIHTSERKAYIDALEMIQQQGSSIEPLLTLVGRAVERSLVETLEVARSFIP